MAIITVCYCDNLPGMHRAVEGCDPDMKFEPTDKEMLFQTQCTHFDVIENVCSQCGLITVPASLCDCEEGKEARNDHSIHVYNPWTGCQNDGPDTRAEDDLGANWKVGFPHKCR